MKTSKTQGIALRMVRKILRSATPFLALASASVCSATTIYYLGTDQTGAQTQIDVAHTSTWLLTPNTDFSFGGGLFNMKDGSAATADVTLSLYQGTDATGPLLASMSLNNTAFCAQASNCGQYQYHQFFFTSAIPLLTGVNYFAALTSSAVNTQSAAYFIKSTVYFISDQSGTAIVPSPIVTAAAANAPEPSGLVLICIGLGMVMLMRNRRDARAAA